MSMLIPRPESSFTGITQPDGLHYPEPTAIAAIATPLERDSAPSGLVQANALRAAMTQTRSERQRRDDILKGCHRCVA